MCRFAVNKYYQSHPEWNSETVRPFIDTEAWEMHQNIPGYKATPLLELPEEAEVLGFKNLFIKDESQRFGVKAFKPLGASYAVFKFLKNHLMKNEGVQLNVDLFSNPEQLKKINPFTFCAATDGNHGKAVAWAARQLFQKAVIFMPANASTERVKNIKAENAEVKLVKGTFDDCVKACADEALKNGWQVISDTAYPGNMTQPIDIMEGYKTIFLEIEMQLGADGFSKIDLLILPAGVGGLAASGAGFLTVKYGEKRPVLLIIEPDDSDCFLCSINAGETVQSPGKQESMMVGLACGIPSLTSWPICRDTVNAFLAIPDKWAVQAMKKYAENGIISGESGSAGLAGLLALTNSLSLMQLKKDLNINKDSNVLCINTEGDTDPKVYKRYIKGI